MRALETGVVILNYGDPADTLACLHTLELSQNLSLDVVVVDNAEDGPEHQDLKAAVGDRATVLCSGGNLGYAAGNNVGIRHLLDKDVDYVWILNPDTRVEPTTLDLLLDELKRVPDCGIVGPRIVYPGDPARIWFDGGIVDIEDHGSTAHVNLSVLESEAGAPHAFDVDYVTGAAMLVRRRVFETVGLIPEQYFLYFEEVDFCRRTQAAGFRTRIDQRARLTHLKRSSGWLPTPYYLYYMTRNRYLFAQDCLGLDPELALDSLRHHFLTPWRLKVEQRAPSGLAEFDRLVEQATADARAGRCGRTDGLPLALISESAR